MTLELRLEENLAFAGVRVGMKQEIGSKPVRVIAHDPT